MKIIKRSLFLIAIVCLHMSLLSGQEKEKVKMKKGWTFGALTVFGYDSGAR